MEDRVHVVCLTEEPCYCYVRGILGIFTDKNEAIVAAYDLHLPKEKGFMILHIPLNTLKKEGF